MVSCQDPDPTLLLAKHRVLLAVVVAAVVVDTVAGYSVYIMKKN